jgi:hypothetical protein
MRCVPVPHRSPSSSTHNARVAMYIYIRSTFSDGLGSSPTLVKRSIGDAPLPRLFTAYPLLPPRGITSRSSRSVLRCRHGEETIGMRLIVAGVFVFPEGSLEKVFGQGLNLKVGSGRWTKEVGIRDDAFCSLRTPARDNVGRRVEREQTRVIGSARALYSLVENKSRNQSCVYAGRPAARPARFVLSSPARWSVDSYARSISC